MSPRPRPRRDNIAFRPNPVQREQIDRLAAELRVTRSEVIRNLISVALAALDEPPSIPMEGS